MELKVLLYLIAGVGYFIYKQYQKFQNDALLRKNKLEIEVSNPTKGYTKSNEPIEVLSNKYESKKESPINKLKPRTPLVKEKIKSLEIEKQGSSSLLFETNNSFTEKIATTKDNELAILNNENKYFEIRNMLLYSELLKRPIY